MTETETLEVKEIVKLKEDEEGLSSGSDLVTEGQIEATVGDNDVAALVDEAQNICAEEDGPTEEMMDTAEPVTNHEETCEDKATEEPQDEAPKEAAAASQESMEVDDEPSSSEVKEKVTEPEPERISTTPPPSSPPEDKSHIPNDGNNNTEDNESNATIPSNTNGDSNNATCDQNSTSTSTQSVLQEEPTPGPLQMPEEVKNSEEAQTPSNCTTTNSSTESMSEVLTTSAPGSCMLKSVVDTTIHDLATSLSLTSSSTPASSLTSSSTSLSPGQGPQPNGSQGLPMLVKPPKTDVLLQTAREVLQLRDEPSGVLIGETRDNPVTSILSLLVFLFCVLTS